MKSLKNRKIDFAYVSQHCAAFGTTIRFGDFWRDGGRSACRSLGQGHVFDTFQIAYPIPFKLKRILS